MAKKKLRFIKKNHMVMFFNNVVVFFGQINDAKFFAKKCVFSMFF